ncbi:MAG: Holliday junction resolvase RuvX [Mycoplasmoidaceae bacterium]|nr:Holliday junction resolvase RuvX [Mycoplasmoidaceae bacterium]
MRALGLDLGTKTMGIAISDSLKIIASGLENFEYCDNDLSICVNKLKEVFHKYQNDIDTIILGYPKGLHNQKNDMTLLVEKFCPMLEEEFKNIKIIY